MKVSDDGYKIRLLRVVPGQELEIDARLRPAWRLYKAFGEFDIVAVQPLVDPEDILPSALDLSGVLSEHSILTFSWFNPDAPAKAPLDTSLPFLTLTFLKISPDLMSAVDPSVEEPVVQAIWRRFNALVEDQHIRTSPSLRVLGSFGWHEVIVALTADRLDDCLAAVSALADLRTSDLFPQAEEASRDRPIFHSSHTIPCITYEKLRSGEFKDLQEIVDATVYIDAVPLGGIASQNWFASLVDSGFDLFETFGDHDYYLRAKSKSVTMASLLSLLMENLRRSPSETGILNPVTATTTQFGREPGSVRPSLIERPVRSDLTVEPDLEAFRIFLQPTFANRPNPMYDPSKYLALRQLFLAYNAAVAGETAGDSVRDLWPFLQALNDAIRRVDLKDIDAWFAEDLLKSINSAIQRFSFGYLQRLRSTLRLQNLDADLYSAYYGAIQRCIVAASCIPIHLNAKRAIFWDGFIVFGFDPDCQRSEFGIINLPASAALSPISWWQLWHEVGHDIAARHQFTVDKKLELDIRRGFVNDRDFAPMIELAEEIFCDIFDFVHGFRGAWPLYLPTIWKFMAGYRRARMRLPYFAIRSLYVKLYASGVRPKDVTREVLEEYYAKLSEEVQDWFGNFPKNPRFILPLAYNLLRAYELAWKTLGEPAATERLDDHQLSGLAELVRPILEGQPIAELNDPRDLILGLLTHLRDTAPGDRLSFPASVAALLSLWRLSMRIMAIRERDYFTREFKQPRLFEN